MGIGTGLLRVPSGYDVSRIGGSDSTRTLIIAACQVLRASGTAGSAVPALGVGQRSSGTVLSGYQMLTLVLPGYLCNTP